MPFLSLGLKTVIGVEFLWNSNISFMFFLCIYLGIIKDGVGGSRIHGFGILHLGQRKFFPYLLVIS